MLSKNKSHLKNYIIFQEKNLNFIELLLSTISHTYYSVTADCCKKFFIFIFGNKH